MIGIGNRIKELRAYLGLSLAKFGDAIGYTATHVSRLERGGTQPKEQLLEKINEAFNVSPDYFKNKAVRIEDAVEKAPAQEIVNSEVSVRLKTIRQERGLSQVELAVLAGIENTLISEVETHNRLLTEDKAKKLADALEVGIEWLQHGIEDKKDYPVNDEMIEWLWRHKDLRESIWERIKKRI